MQQKTTRVSDHSYAAINRDSLRDGFTGALLVTELFCHQRRVVSTTQLRRPLHFARQSPPKRPLHPASNLRDNREATLWSKITEVVSLILLADKEKYLCKDIWTTQISLS